MTQAIVHGQKATVLREYLEDMFEVRLWDGQRHVGDIVVPSSEIKMACAWCNDNPAQISDLCNSCYKLSA